MPRSIPPRIGATDPSRYQAIVISDEEAAQTSRLEYLLANGVKEGLVERVQDWPGVHCVRNLLDGEPLEGLWFDRTKEYSARNRGKTISPGQFATTETVTLSPLPCWEGGVWRNAASSHPLQPSTVNGWAPGTHPWGFKS